MNEQHTVSETLAVVMPVYNEQDVVTDVISQWTSCLAELDVDYALHVYNDGSTDATPTALQSAAATDDRVIIHDKPNAGHGPTILQGYRENAASDWLLQIDSDGEIGPEHFAQFWQARERCDIVIGRRRHEGTPLARRIVSHISRWTVRVLFGTGIHDVNCPYRLLRSATVEPLVRQIPADTFAPNVILSGLACRHRLRIHEIPVVYQARQGSLAQWKLLRAAIRSFGQTLRFARRLRSRLPL